MSNRMKKEEARKHAEAREGLTPKEIEQLDAKEEEEKRLELEAHYLHTRLFEEEYLAMSDLSWSNLSKSAQEEINDRRVEMGITPRSATVHNNDSYKFVRKLLEDGKRQTILDLMEKYNLRDEDILAEAEERMAKASNIDGPLETEKFDGVEADEGTTILHRQEATLGNYDVLYEKWFWNGISAESIIFANEDVTDKSDEYIIAEVKTSPLVKSGSEFTIKRLESGYIFVNFNFEIEGDNGEYYDETGIVGTLERLEAAQAAFTDAYIKKRTLPVPRGKLDYFERDTHIFNWRVRKVVNDKKHFMMFKKIEDKIIVEKDYEDYPGNPYSLEEGLKVYNRCKAEGWEPLDEAPGKMTDWEKN